MEGDKLLSQIDPIVAPALTDYYYVINAAGTIQGRVTAQQLLNLFTTAGVGWNLDGNTVIAEKSLGTIDNFDLPLKVNNVEKLRLTTDGRFFGKSLHNNPGSMTGTADQYVGSGTYTPTASALVNISSATTTPCQWIRVGNVVTVSGSINLVPTVTLTITTFELSLPIASNLAVSQNCAGTFVSTIPDGAATNGAGAITAQVVTNNAKFACFPTTTSGITYAFTFTYVVL